MAKSTERHSRETKAKFGAIYGISAEQLRKTRICVETFSDYGELAMAGKISCDKAYRLAIGDDRASLYVKIPKHLHEQLKVFSQEIDCTMGDALTILLTQIFGEGDDDE